MERATPDSIRARAQKRVLGAQRAAAGALYGRSWVSHGRPIGYQPHLRYNPMSRRHRGNAVGHFSPSNFGSVLRHNEDIARSKLAKAEAKRIRKAKILQSRGHL